MMMEQLLYIMHLICNLNVQVQLIYSCIEGTWESHNKINMVRVNINTDYGWEGWINKMVVIAKKVEEGKFWWIDKK